MEKLKQLKQEKIKVTPLMILFKKKNQIIEINEFYNLFNFNYKIFLIYY